MSRRNVDLVIKAKDEAAKVLDQITAALEQFGNATKGVDSSADKTENSLSQLGAAISKLEKSLGGLDVASKLGKELRQAEKELARLEGQFDGVRAETIQLERQLTNTGAQATRFASKLDGATAALARQKTAVKTAKADQKELSAAYTQAERAQAQLTARQAQLPQLIEKQSAALDKASARYTELASRIQSTADPSRTLREQFEASARSVDQNTAKLNKLTTEYGEIGGQIRAAGSAMTIFGQQAEKAATNVSRQQKVLGQIDENLTRVKAQSKAAGDEQARLAGQFDKSTKSLDRQQQTIDRAEANYVELAVSAGKADAALAELANRSLGKLSSELKDQRLATLRAKKEYVDLSAEATRLASSIGKVGVPTREMAEAFARTKISAGAAKQEYQQQRVALELMGRAYRDTGNDIASINGTQTRFQSILAQTGTQLQKVAANTDRAQKELNQLYSASTQAASGMSRVSAASMRTAAANERGAASTNRMAAAYRQFYGDTRRSLSLLQRIRGEVLSLVAAYGGLYGVIEVLRGTTDAYQKLEAAQARLTVAVGGDQVAAAQELDFLRRTADRLGITFGVLADEYSKFAIATKGTNLEGQATRDIFLGVAEAARVNRSSVYEMSGVFTALTQIVSKGVVMSEELKQQLGDRLPGAISMMAASLEVTTGELMKMMEQGEVSADALLPFAQELMNRFGEGLPQALESVTTAIGRLGNEAFEALLRFGQAGFLEAFADLARTITETLQSADFQAFSDNASAAMSKLVRFIGFAVENFRLLAAAIAGFIGLRLTPVILAIAAAFKGFLVQIAGTAASVTAVGVAAQGSTAKLAAMGAAVGRLRIALMALLSTTGIGILVAAIGAGIALWASEADNATEALIEHERIVDEVKNTYEAAGREVEGFNESIVKSLKVTDARRNLLELKEALIDTLQEFKKVDSQEGISFASRLFGAKGASKEFVNEVDEIIQATARGETEIEGLAARIDEVAEKYVDGNKANRQYAEGMVAAAEAVEEQSKAVRNAELVLTALTGTAEEQAAALEELNGEVNVSAASYETAAEKAAKFEAALAEIRDIIPSIKEELDYLEKSEALEKMLLNAIQTAQSWNDIAAAMKLAGQAQSELNSGFGNSVAGLASGSTGTEAAASLLREFEGFRATPYWDVNAYRTGYGSDTITLSDGTIKKVTQGMRVSVEDANRDLIRRIETEFGPTAESAAGSARFATFNPQQQAALISIAYNYGNIPDRIVDAVRNGTDAQIAAAIRSLGGDNGGVNQSRRNKEAALFEATAPNEAAAQRAIKEDERAAEEKAKAAEKAADEAAKQQEATEKRIANNEFEISQQELLNQGKERQAKIEEAIRAAKADDPNISEEELQKIREQVGAVFDLEQARKGATTAAEKAAEAEKEVNNLLAQRRALEEQIKLAVESGNTEQAENLRLKIGEINAELLAAIENAQNMWKAVGGSEATAAIAKLETAKIETQNFGIEAGKTYLQWERVADLFVTGLANAFDVFAQKVAEGESAGEAARQAFLQFAADFLREIAMMIIQQAIFNALQGVFGGTSFGRMIGVGAAHTGGLIGSSRAGSGNRTRNVHPAAFASAMRYHKGGIVGLTPGEVPIIAQEGEEMLTRDDPRHMLNGGGKDSKSSGREGMTIINTIDPAAALEQALSTSKGREVLLNTMRGTRTEVKAALG